MQDCQQALQEVKHLCHVYPDIEHQLCSRHSAMFSKLKANFKKLYDSLDPDRFIIVKGSAQISSYFGQYELSLALQNGLIFMITPTYPNSKIFINSNWCQQELIISSDGTQIEGEWEEGQQIKKVIELATEDMPLNKIKGAVIYIFSNLPANSFSYKKALLIGCYLSILKVNGMVQQYSINDLIQKLSTIKQQKENQLTTQIQNNQNSSVLQKYTLQKYFNHYQNRQFCFKIGGQTYSIQLDKKQKLIIAKLSFTQAEKQYHQQRIIELKKIYQKMIAKINRINNSTYSSVHQMCFDLEKGKLNTVLHHIQASQPNQTGQSHKNILQGIIKQLQLFTKWSHKQITFAEFIKHKWDIDSQVNKLYASTAIEKVENIMKETKIWNATIFSGQFLLIGTQSVTYTELFIRLKKQLYANKKNPDKIVQQRWGNDPQIGEKMFSSVPSPGISIYDPSDQIWFD